MKIPLTFWLILSLISFIIILPCHWNSPLWENMVGSLAFGFFAVIVLFGGNIYFNYLHRQVRRKYAGNKEILGRLEEDFAKERKRRGYPPFELGADIPMLF